MTEKILVSLKLSNIRSLWKWHELLALHVSARASLLLILTLLLNFWIKTGRNISHEKQPHQSHIFGMFMIKNPKCWLLITNFIFIRIVWSKWYRLNKKMWPGPLKRVLTWYCQLFQVSHEGDCIFQPWNLSSAVLNRDRQEQTAFKGLATPTQKETFLDKTCFHLVVKFNNRPLTKKFSNVTL